MNHYQEPNPVNSLEIGKIGQGTIILMHELDFTNEIQFALHNITYEDGQIEQQDQIVYVPNIEEYQTLRCSDIVTVEKTMVKTTYEDSISTLQKFGSSNTMLPTREQYNANPDYKYQFVIKPPSKRKI